MWSKVEHYIDRYKLLNFKNLYIVALSGGADSVALLLLLREAGYHVHAAHCNFHLRGDESDRDESFCVGLCRQFDVELHRAHFDTYEYSEFHKVSIEMAARELRYNWFSQLCRDLGAAGVCIAHHRDDSVETVILNLVRGTGLRGLTGIQPRTEQILGKDDKFKLVVLRPLLCVSRADIESYLVKRGQKYVTDSTNFEAEVLRNKVRLQVLPLLRELNPAVSENIQRTVENLTGAQSVLTLLTGKYNNLKELDISQFSDYRSREYIVYEWLKNYGFNGVQVRQILEADTGGMVSSAMGYDVLKDRSRLILEPTIQPFTPKHIPEEGTYVFSEESVPNRREEAKNARFTVCLKRVYISKNPDVATFDAAKVAFPLTVRRAEQGDWICPFGMCGRKLLSDLMTDLKMTVFEKRRQLVVVDAKGVVIWVVGLRISRSVAVSEATQSVLEVAFKA